MSQVNEQLEQQRNKRKRIKRMKRFIMTVLLLYMTISLAVMGYLLYKVTSLQKQLNALKGDSTQTASVLAGNDTSSASEYVLNENAMTDLENYLEEGEIPMVYLTFDDGPSESTNEILDILDDYNVKATFFVVGKTDPEYTDVYKRIVDDGHTLGMHSYSHKYSEIYASEAAFEADFDKIQNFLYDTTGVESVFYRFPGGSSNQVSNLDMTQAIRFLNDNGITYVDWNVASGDATSQAYSADDLVENVMTDVVKYKTSVVLMHDATNKTATVDALPTLIEDLQAIGAEILPITENTTHIQHVTISED